jgi:hypothetical protein
MTHLELLAAFYQAFKTDDTEYAMILQTKYPELCAEIYGMVLRTETAAEFNDLVKTLTK